MRKPLLSIAIPTYNRFFLLDECLSYILPQVGLTNSLIEFIISDNCSNDDTKKVIDKYNQKFSNLNIIINTQSINTGYFGNFKKCREISTGKYLWILSDDFIILDGSLNKILNVLRKNDGVGMLYLNNKTNHFKNICDISFSKPLQSIDKFIYSFGNSSTYISNTIILNRKDNDKVLFDRFRENDLLGFVLLLNAFKFKSEVLILSSSLLKVRPAKPSGSVLGVWIKDSMDCVRFMQDLGFISDIAIRKFINSIIKNNIRPNLLEYKFVNKDKEAEDKSKLIKTSFSNYINYWVYISPLFLINKKFITIYFKIMKFNSKFRIGVNAVKWLIICITHRTKHEKVS